MKHLATLTGLALLAACASTSTPTDPGPEGLESTGTDPQPVTAEEEFTAKAKSELEKNQTKNDDGPYMAKKGSDGDGK